jgi:hypothetical protein
MRRVLIAGITGSGKTTLGRRLAPALGLEYHELDDLYYGPGMRMAPEFPSVIDRITEGEQWLFDSQGPPVDSEAPLTCETGCGLERTPWSGWTIRAGSWSGVLSRDHFAASSPGSGCGGVIASRPGPT